MKGSPTTRIALKIDVIGLENTLFAGASASFSLEILPAGAVNGLSIRGMKIQPWIKKLARKTAANNA